MTRRLTLLAVLIFALSVPVLRAQQPSTSDSAPKPAAPPKAEPAKGAPAAPSTAARPSKIGFIDYVRALSDTGEGQKEFAKVQEWATKQDEMMKKEASDLNTARNKYLQDQLKMAPDARADAERQLQVREKKLTRKQEDLNQELGQRRQGILKTMGGKMAQIVQEYG